MLFPSQRFILDGETFKFANNVYVCNSLFVSYIDCIDGTDETDCNNIVTCQTNERLCKSDKKCIPESYWCDQDPDCKHNFFFNKIYLNAC